MKYAICALALLTSVAFAAKTPTVFGPGVEGFLKTKAPDYAYNTVTNDGVVFVSFTGLDAKSQLQLTKCENNIMINNIKQVKQKGKITGTADNIVIGTLGVPSGGPATMIKLKGINIGTVLSADLKMIQCKNLVNLYATTPFDNVGTTIKAMENIAPPVGATERGVIIARIKGMSAKVAIEHLDLTKSIATKVGKTKIKAPYVCDILMIGNQFIIKRKNECPTEDSE